MQYLTLEDNTTISSLSRLIGQHNVSSILAENSIPRVPNISEQWKKQCDYIIETDSREITASQKIALLNGLTNSEDLFEKACLMDSNEWKIFATTHAFTDALKVPESLPLPTSDLVSGVAKYSTSGLNIASNNAAVISRTDSTGRSINSTIGQFQDLATSNLNPVSSTVYKAVMNSLQTTGEIDYAILNTVNTTFNAITINSSNLNVTSIPTCYSLAWGKIQMYSTVLKELIDFPVYPEQIETTRQANYTSMPDIIYQYEPWITFESSGPREQTLAFHMHRDMWSGDHRDGRANKLIRFCEANTFADYNGSAVITPLVRFYIDGSLFISGVIKHVDVTWTGPLGLDNWYLEFTLSITIQEISESTLNCKTVYSRQIKEA